VLCLERFWGCVLDSHALQPPKNCQTRLLQGTRKTSRRAYYVVSSGAVARVDTANLAELDILQHARKFEEHPGMAIASRMQIGASSPNVYELHLC